jgi:two-component system, NtrC family, response regulator AtoC
MAMAFESGNRSALQQEETGWISGTSTAMRTLESVVGEIASTDIPVLLVGESGTGKEMLATRVHQLSGHRHEPLRRIPCASTTATELSAELGLHSNGENKAATRAHGTVFFDEISELDAACQRYLLSALPDGDGCARRGMIEARVISTTSKNLDEEMRAGRFRNELYYRINGVCLRLPALRDRKEDIPLMVEALIRKHASLLGRPRPSVSSRTLEIFRNHSWPGNIRELENMIKKIVALNDENLATEELARLSSEPRRNPTVEAPSYSLKAAARAASREAERELIMKALARTRWNRKRAAQELQISYKSLLYKLKQIGFEDSEVNQ